MATALTVNGIAYSFPQTGDQGWGDNVTNWASAVTNGMLQKAGGSFVLTAEIDFGSSFGLKSLYYKSRGSNPAAAGVVRLASTESVSWRNNANGADLSLATTAGDVLQFNSITLADLSSVQTFTNKTLTAPIISTISNGGTLTLPSSTDTLVGKATTDILTNKTLTAPVISTISNTGTLTLPTSTDTLVGKATTDVFTNKSISGSTNTFSNIPVNTLAALTASRAVVSDGSGFVSAATTTATEIGYVNGVTSAIQTQLNTKVGTSAPTISQPVINGFTDGSSAASGVVGEELKQTRVLSAATALSSSVVANVTSTALTLTAGDWDISAAVVFDPGATTNVTIVQCGISTTSAALAGGDTLGVPDGSGQFRNKWTQAAAVPASQMTLVIPPYRVSLSGSTIFYLVASSTFTVSTMGACGSIRARRVR